MHMNRIDSEAGKSLADGLSKNKTVKWLDLNRNPLGQDTQDVFFAFAKVIVPLGRGLLLLYISQLSDGALPRCVGTPSLSPLLRTCMTCLGIALCCHMRHDPSEQ